MIRPGAESALKKIFFTFFYSTSYLININLNLEIFLPFLFYLVLASELTGDILIKTILVIALANFFYNAVYIINDLLDYQKDRKEKTYKISALSRYDAVNYIYGYFAACAAILVLLYLAGFLSGARYFLLYLLILTATAIIHSKFSKIKPVSIFVERWLKIISPVFFLKIIFNSPLFHNFLVLILILFPFIAHRAYLGYLEKKKKQFGRKNIAALYSLYYGLLLALLLFKGTVFPDGFVFFAIEYIIIYAVIKTISKIAAGFFQMKFLEKFYADDLEEKGRIFSEMAVHSAAVIVLSIYIFIK